jgi:hypothetical protein
MYSLAGDMLYWSRINDRKAGGINLSRPNTQFEDGRGYLPDESREWYYWSYDLDKLVPGYNVMTYTDQRGGDVGAYGTANGVYGAHGDGSPPVPYMGKLFFLASNALVVFDTAGTPAPSALPLAEAPVAPPAEATYTDAELTERLTNAVLSIIEPCLASEDWAACHLKPGMAHLGNLDVTLQRGTGCLTDWEMARGDYFANPGDYLPTLLRSLPHLAPDLRAKLRSYIAYEFTTYPPDKVNHIGWRNGVSRDSFTYAAEVAAALPAHEPSMQGRLNPQNSYALWLYAQEFGGAAELLARAAAIWQDPPPDADLQTYPFLHHAFISQFEGYLGLQTLAGVPLDGAKVAELDRLLALRAATFTQDSPFSGVYYEYPGVCRDTNLWRQFYLLTPRTADYLRTHARAQVQAAVDEYSWVAPFWFVSGAEEAWAEGVLRSAYDTIGLFTAKARILQEPRATLAPYLDVPTMRGDLFYVQNLLDLLAAPSDEPAQTTISPLRVLTSGAIPQYGKCEIAFDVLDSPHTDPLLPYAPDGAGISVDLQLLKPGGTTPQVIPCFWFQPYAMLSGDVTPSGTAEWRCRVMAETPGTYQYAVRVTDANGTTESRGQTFAAAASDQPGYVRTNGKFFEFANGAPFPYLLVNAEEGSPFGTLSAMQQNIPLLGSHGVRFVRWWPVDNSAHYTVSPYGGDLRAYWRFGPAWTAWDEVDTANGDLLARRHYYYTAQTVPGVPGATHRLQVRARADGEQVLRLEVVGLDSPTVDICAPENTQHQTCDYRLAGWQSYTINGRATAAQLTVALRGLYVNADAPTPYGIVREGRIRTGQVTLQRDEDGALGPNLLYHGAPDTHEAVDAVGAARLDEWFKLAEQHGVYARMTLFHKEDAALASLQADGTVGPANQANFYSSPVARMYQAAYIRYFMARWGYSPALHSVEMANEQDINQASYEAGWNYARLVCQYAPRPILVASSFWGWWNGNYFQDPVNGDLLDHGDKHWFANQGAENPELISHTWADTVANVRECRQRLSEYGYSKPILRGETGVAVTTTQPQDPRIVEEPTGTYYHKQVWTHVGILGDQCAGEWYPRIFVSGGAYPNADYRTEEVYAAYERFMAGEAVNNGTHGEIGTDLTGVTVDNPQLRAFGSLDTATYRVLLWVDNAQHTWAGVASGVIPTPATGTVSVTLPAGGYVVEWWDTRAGALVSMAYLLSDGILRVPVVDLTTDMALKAYRDAAPATLQPIATATPTMTSTAPATLTMTPTMTVTPTMTPTATATPTMTPTATATPTMTSTMTPTMTATATKTPRARPTKRPH